MLKKIIALIFVFTIFLAKGEYTMTEAALSTKEQEIAKISSYTASGDLENLQKALKSGLDNGLTVNQIKEVLVQMYAYCGFPRSLNGIVTFMNVLNESDKKYDEGEAGKPLAKDSDKHAIGEKVQTELCGAPVKGAVMDFAPAIDDYLKEHLFGDIFARGVLTHREREVATIAALSSMDGVEPQLKAHIGIGKNTGLTDEEVEQILKLTSGAKQELFGRGAKNEAYAKYFVGQSYLKRLTSEGVSTANVTFEPKCRNNWHIHHKGGQILLVTDGEGFYQEFGKPAQRLTKGDVVNIPAEVKHWHGAAANSWFTHVAIEVPSEGGSTEWLEPVSDEEYAKVNEQK